MARRPLGHLLGAFCVGVGVCVEVGGREGGAAPRQRDASGECVGGPGGFMPFSAFVPDEAEAGLFAESRMSR
jgi:hypothetical protein